jgi:uncharacterized protein GlcG (DUF336 family)
MDVLTSKLANQIAQTVLSEGDRLGLAPLCCTVLDRGGHMLALLRDERASIYRPQIATAKAAGCLGMGFGGRELKRRAEAIPAFFSGLNAIFPNGILPVPGGVLIRSGSEIVGAVGVSGDTSDNDDICAVAAIRAAGFVPDNGDSP